MNRNWILASLIGGGIDGRSDKDQNLPGVYITQSRKLLNPIKYPEFYRKFEKLLRADREAALGEAVAFSLLKTYFRAKPEPADVPGTGGADFVCLKGTPAEFVVEVTYADEMSQLQVALGDPSFDQWSRARDYTQELRKKERCVSRADEDA
jgi:hypothetical protein